MRFRLKNFIQWSEHQHQSTSFSQGVSNHFICMLLAWQDYLSAARAALWYDHAAAVISYSRFPEDRSTGG